MGVERRKSIYAIYGAPKGNLEINNTDNFLNIKNPNTIK
jgi:hypothetical protein